MADSRNPPELGITEALYLLHTFRGADLTQTSQRIERSVKGVSADSHATVLVTRGAKSDVLGAAGLLEQLAAQIDVVIHTLGILFAEKEPGGDPGCVALCA